MNLEFAIFIAFGYLTVGIVMCYFGPLAKKRRTEVFSTSMALALSKKSASRAKLLAFRASLLIGITLLWPVLWFDDYRTNKKLEADQDRTIHEMGDSSETGLTFSRMGGVGTLSCDDCKWTQKIDSFSHGLNGWSSDFQCQACGKFAGRHYEEPTFGSDAEYNLQNIEHAQTILRLCEEGMQNTPKDKWLDSWESGLAESRAELNQVPEEIRVRAKTLRDDANAAFNTSLICDCGGVLDRDKVLFCPQCRCKKLSFQMLYIT